MKFALYELKKYAAIIGIDVDIELSVDLSVFDTSKFFRFEAKYDDAFRIKVKDGKGTIKATNEANISNNLFELREKELIPSLINLSLGTR